MSPGVRYTLARIVIFVVCAIPVYLLTPATLNALVKLLIALLVSAVVSYIALRRWRDELAERLAASARARNEERERLRAALAGEDSPDGSRPPDRQGGTSNDGG